jgi:hypothetical protein
MEEREEMSWEEDLARVIKILAGTAAVPLKVAAEIAGDAAKTVANYAPQPSAFASTLIELRIRALRTITEVMKEEISRLESYKEGLGGAEEAKKKEKVTVE